jgi:hypothetical protein
VPIGWRQTSSFKSKDGSDEPPADGDGRNREADFHREKRSNDTDASTTNPDARLYRKGPGKRGRALLLWKVARQVRQAIEYRERLLEGDIAAKLLAERLHIRE